MDEKEQWNEMTCEEGMEWAEEHAAKYDDDEDCEWESCADDNDGMECWIEYCEDSCMVYYQDE